MLRRQAHGWMGKSGTFRAQNQEDDSQSLRVFILVIDKMMSAKKDNSWIL